MADIRFVNAEVEIAEGIVLRRDGEDWLLESTTGNTGVSFVFTRPQVEALVETIRVKLAREHDLDAFAARLRAREASA